MKEGPEPIGDILGRLFAARGWGRQQERRRLEEIWAEVVGAPGARCTQVVSLKRGVLEVLVANAVVLQELAHFQKRRLLAELRRRLPNRPILDLRFRSGVLKSPKDN